jgi:HK97 family phage portal protein
MFFKTIEKIYPSHQIIDKSPETAIGMLLAGNEYAYGDVESIEKTYENIGWVYRCIDITATNIARLPIRVLQVNKSDEEIDITDRPEFLIFRSPNKFQTIYDFIYESISRLRLQGELFWELQTEENNNRIVAVWADWSSDEIEVVGDPENLIKLYRRRINGQVYEFLPEEVFYIKYFNPFSILRGMAPLRSGRDAMTLELNAVNYNKNFFSQGMQPAGAFTSEQIINRTERDRLRETLQEYYGGVAQAHKPLVLWNGLKFDPLSKMSLRDAEYTELRQMNREDICSILGVPLEIFGLGNTTHSNKEFAWKIFWNETLIPAIVKLEALINKSLIPRLTSIEKVKIKIDLSEVEALKESQEKKMEIYDKGFKDGALTPNDIRVDVFGKDPITDPSMDITYLPGALLPSGSQPPEKAKRKGLTLTRDISSVDGRTKIWKTKMADLEKHEGKFRKEMKAFFNRQEKEVLKNLENKSIKQGPLILEGEIFDLQKWIDELEKLGEPLMIEVILDAVSEYMNAEDFDLTHPAVKSTLGIRVENFSRFTNEYTAKLINEQLREGFSNNETIAQISKRIKENVFSEKITDKRANLIARTEAVGSSNYGTQQALVQASIAKKMWITSRDELVRDSHQIDGQTVGTNEDFHLLDGQVMPFPQDFNERCICIGVTE